MAEESTVPEGNTDSRFDDVSLDAFNETTEETTEDTETSPVEDKTTEEVSDEEQTPDSDETSTESEESEQSEDTEEPEVDLKSMSRRERAAYFAQEREQQRIESETKQEVAQAVSQAYQPQSVEDLQQLYMEQGASEFEALQLARDDIREQRAQIAEATAQISELNANLRVDAVEAQAKYEWMNPANEGKGFSKKTTTTAAQLFELATVKDERTGQIVDAKMTPSQVAELIDQIRKEAMRDATIKAQKNAESQMASVAPPTSARQPAKSGNSLKEMEKRLEDVTF